VVAQSSQIKVLTRAVTEWLEATPSPALRPLEELLPPTQRWRRHGPWLAALCMAALGAAGWWWGMG